MATIRFNPIRSFGRISKNDAAEARSSILLILPEFADGLPAASDMEGSLKYSGNAEADLFSLLSWLGRGVTATPIMPALCAKGIAVVPSYSVPAHFTSVSGMYGGRPFIAVNAWLTNHEFREALITEAARIVIAWPADMTPAAIARHAGRAGQCFAEADACDILELP